MNALALKCCAVALIVVTVGCNVGCKCTCDGVKEKQTVTVRAEDISTKVQIIGRLGQPIGSLLRIRGKWIAQLSKGVPLHFEVSLINGKELHEKIEIDGELVGPIYSHHKGRGHKPGELWDWRFDDAGTEPWPTPSDG